MTNYTQVLLLEVNRVVAVEYLRRTLYIEIIFLFRSVLKSFDMS